ncbi:hypothetical protein WDW89_01595 [Deltaproteobacteria bacterium TL4]
MKDQTADQLMVYRLFSNEGSSAADQEDVLVSDSSGDGRILFAADVETLSTMDIIELSIPHFSKAKRRYSSVYLDISPNPVKMSCGGSTMLNIKITSPKYYTIWFSSNLPFNHINETEVIFSASQDNPCPTGIKIEFWEGKYNPVKTVVIPVKIQPREDLKFQHSQMGFAWKVIDQYYKSLGVYTGSTVKLALSQTPSIPGSLIKWSGEASGQTGYQVSVTFNSPGDTTVSVDVQGTNTQVLVRVKDRPSGLGEAEFAFANPQKTYTANQHNIANVLASQEPEIWASQVYPGQQHNTKVDAAKHTYWSCLLTQYIDAFYSEGLTNAHEVSSPGPGTETVMDYYNNTIGRSLVSPTATDNTFCRNAVQSAVSNGTTLYLDSSYGAENKKEDALLQPTNK